MKTTVGLKYFVNDYRLYLFLKHSTAADLMDKLNEVIKHLDLEKLYQISMDGRAVNINFLNEFKIKQEENAFHSITDIGTCSLHIVHGPVKTNFDKFNMKIKEALKGGFQIFMIFLQGLKAMKVFQDQ